MKSGGFETQLTPPLRSTTTACGQADFPGSRLAVSLADTHNWNAEGLGGGARVNPVEKMFLRAKHWQLFIALCAVPSIGQMLALSSFRRSSSPVPHECERAFALSGCAFAILMLAEFERRGTHVCLICAERKSIALSSAVKMRVTFEYEGSIT